MDEKQLINEICQLKKLLKEKEDQLAKIQYDKQPMQKNELNNEEIARYSRQILMPEIGVKGQVKLKKSSVLIVGAGGLGCPSSLYLAGAGVGHIGIVDYDEIEITNLHRQLLFTISDIKTSKVDAAAHHLTRRNANVQVTPYKIQLDSSNVLDIIKNYDVVLDATDNVPTRYLLNDACVFSGKPLVSASALKMEGQLTVYNYDDGPCYRCIYPKPPPPETVTNCGDGGVLGAVVGTIGVLQALEALKIILNMPGVLSQRLLVFDGSESIFRNIRLRSKNNNCQVCSSSPSITELQDYEEFCGSKANDKDPNLKLVDDNDRITVEDYNKIINSSIKHVLIDVRSIEEFDICHLNDAINIPYTNMKQKSTEKTAHDLIQKILELDEKQNVYLICRRGNDSQRATKLLRDSLKNTTNIDLKRIKDIAGGINAWSRVIDPSFPIY
ncbi:hypothetical protein HCN44_008454 [Aphidius gifuensis]|uniref:Adenylyltransferase and sulfurtransferase MOCS3 homolog n=1 Tax=Aphidius gifuensis TaxID=684658 RepID=A0A835CR34_APHGI|nr:adenylyltransferase and sulfurtransferase MOCS3 [Aphidius gifuensis]KAF7989780.1 hypothetical protein HCN44_008454 [Aphidius gifuensis]